MRINLENKSADIEPRDWNYVMPAYIRSYMFYSKNEAPERIVMPMFQTVKNPITGQDVPVEWVPDTSAIAVEIAEDGSNIPEATEEQIAVKDEVEDTIKQIKEIAVAESGDTKTSPAKAAFAKVEPDRQPRVPDKPIPPGQPLDDMGPRDKRDQRRVARDLKQEPNVDEEKEIPAEIVKPKEQ